ncbi:MAG: Holliday junction resolvase RuvX [Succinivibrio sp.]|nr:Holliday junction resolvase RuvX [Succinivibrio sp.]
MRVMAFDYGLRHIGVAVGSTEFQTTEELPCLVTKFGKVPEPQLLKLVRQWQPQLLVVGIPLNLDGTEQEMTVRARRFAQKLQTLTSLPLAYVDERLSSKEAKAEIFATGGFGALAKDKGHVDSLTACILLEQYFSEQAQHGSN